MRYSFERVHTLFGCKDMNYFSNIQIIKKKLIVSRQSILINLKSNTMKNMMQIYIIFFTFNKYFTLFLFFETFFRCLFDEFCVFSQPIRVK